VLGQDEPDLPPKPAPNVIMSYLKIDSPERYVLHVVMGVRANELEEALLIMPFNLSVKLLEYINSMFCALRQAVREPAMSMSHSFGRGLTFSDPHHALRAAWMKNGWETELACRCLFYMLRIHQNQIVSNQVALHTMDSLRINTRSQIRRFKVSYRIGFYQHNGDGARYETHLRFPTGYGWLQSCGIKVPQT
jgi:U3 small nucleolar RNA-associated protein 12